MRDAADKLLPALGPLRPPRHPIALARFGLRALRSAAGLARRFDGERAPALVAGMAAHSMLRLDERPTAAVGLVLALTGHAVGWPVARGGSQAVADALASYLRSLGGEIETGRRVESVDELGDAGAILLDVTPRQVLALAGHRLPARYRRGLERYRYGPGVFKLDWALDGPIPWTRAGLRARRHRAPRRHLRGDRRLRGRRHRGPPQRAALRPARPAHALRPEPAPAGKHTAWAYCHVPSGSTRDMTAAIEGQIERFAPGFRDRVLARASMHAAEMEAYNPNYVGGDINGGRMDLGQLFTRPVARPSPYTTPDRRLFICSSSTPPGAASTACAATSPPRRLLKRG